jgi:hypothetical protein
MMLGCHVVRDRAVEIVQVVAIAIAAGIRVDDLARVPLSFPTYAGILGARDMPRGPVAQSGVKLTGEPVEG